VARPWFSVVTFGGPASTPARVGSLVSRDVDACILRARSLAEAGTPTVRVVRCSTRVEARAADISEPRPVAWQS
jgi:hypothetical protein